MTTDAYGTPYANTELKAGDTVKVDDGFRCMRRWTDHEVHQDEQGLYLECRDGKHYLDAQLMDTYYLGLYIVNE